jgi:hydrogenase small subunit
MPSLIWLQGATDNGCSISFLNADQPDVVQIVEKFDVQVIFHPTINPTSGPEAVKAMEPYERGDEPLDVLVVEGAVQKGPNGTGAYCLIGERPLKDMVVELADKASYTVAVGTCATFGGVAAADPNPTDATGLQFHKDQSGGLLGTDYRSGAGLPVVNLSGCPAHPDWVTKTLGAVLLGMGDLIELDEYQRPKVFYEPLSHHGCPRNEYFEHRVAARKFADKGCLFTDLGCKGPLTPADCNSRLWNRQSSKTRVGSPCLGCTEPSFPDEGSGQFFHTKKILGFLPARFPIGISGVRGIFHVVGTGFDKMAAPERLKERRS